jgi:hypothetical protein
MAIVIPYVKQTWTDGSGGGTPISAARLGVLEEGILDVSQAPAVRVFHNTTQSATSGVGLALAFNSERYDQAGGAASTMHDTVTNNSRLTAIYAGIYKITGQVQWAASAGGTFRTADIRLNGATVIARSGEPPMNTTGNGLVVTTDYSLAVNDYVELVATQDSGGALNVLNSANYSPEFMMVRVG